MKSSLTIAIPLYNEEDGVENLYKELNKEIQYLQEFVDLNIVLVNDGSTDRTQELLESFFTDDLFQIIIDDTSLDREIKNLVIYKKALFYAEEIDDNENTLLEILNPLINSESVWKSQALYLMAEYFYSKNQKQKSKEFFEKIISLENPNPDIIIEVQKRLNRDFGE